MLAAADYTEPSRRTRKCATAGSNERIVMDYYKCVGRPLINRFSCTQMPCCASRLIPETMCCASLFGCRRFRDFFVLLPDTAVLLDYWMDSTCTTFRGCDIGCQVQLANKQNRMHGVMQSLNHLVAGAVAGAISRTVRARFTHG